MGIERCDDVAGQRYTISTNMESCSEVPCAECLLPTASERLDLFL